MGSDLIKYTDPEHHLLSNVILQDGGNKMWWGGKWKVVTWWAIFKQIYPPRHRWTRPVFGTSFTEPIIVKKSAHQNTPLGKSHRCLIHTTCRRNIDLQSKMSITRERGFNRCFSFYRSRPRSIRVLDCKWKEGLRQTGNENGMGILGIPGTAAAAGETLPVFPPPAATSMTQILPFYLGSQIPRDPRIPGEIGPRLDWNENYEKKA